MRPWYETKPRLLDEIKAQLKQEYPTLHVVVEDGSVHIRGSLPVLDAGRKHELDRFAIDIGLPADFPRTPPTVRETGGRIPQTADRHIYTDGTACLYARPEAGRFWSPTTTLVAFISGPVLRFFENQACFELTKQWLYGERPHGTPGILESYMEEIGTTDPEVVLRCLLHLTPSRIRGDLLCYCGSGKTLARCHQAKVTRLRVRIAPQEARRSYYEIKKWLDGQATAAE